MIVAVVASATALVLLGLFATLVLIHVYSADSGRRRRAGAMARLLLGTRQRGTGFDVKDCPPT